MNWSKLYKSELVDENLVPRIHLIELLEKDSSYHNDLRNYFNRIKDTLQYIPEQYHEAAIALFSSVIYIPEQVLNESFSFFWETFKREKYSQVLEDDDILSKNQFFEVDPSGLINKFCHHNGIQQRLHPDHFIRIQDVYVIRDTLIKILHTAGYIQKEAFDLLKKLSRKKDWIILTDKALSGQSLFKDLERYLFLRDIISESFGYETIVTVFAQIITEDALEYGKSTISRSDFLEIRYGLCFDETMKVNSPKCILFKSRNILQQVNELCAWFADTILSKDKDNYDRMREKSKDDLRFGYLACGLTLVDHTNCPTNSVPLLWYNNSEYFNHLGIPQYMGPYPRVHSRLGKQLKEPSQDAWEDLTKNKKRIIEVIKQLNND